MPAAVCLLQLWPLFTTVMALYLSLGVGPAQTLNMEATFTHRLGHWWGENRQRKYFPNIFIFAYFGR